MNREEHLVWCKERAFAYCDLGKPHEAITSMLSDISKHPETKSPALEMMAIDLMMIGKLDTVHEAREFIEGFR